MAVDASRGSMVSRSVRLHEDTLKKLEVQAEKEGKGVTVLMRDIIEDYLKAPVGEFQHIGHVGELYELESL